MGWAWYGLGASDECPKNLKLPHPIPGRKPKESLNASLRGVTPRSESVLPLRTGEGRVTAIPALIWKMGFLLAKSVSGADDDRLITNNFRPPSLT
jgi:hypothetical protein